MIVAGSSGDPTIAAADKRLQRFPVRPLPLDIESTDSTSTQSQKGSQIADIPQPRST